MKEIISLAELIADKLKTSEVHNEYIMAKRSINGNTELKNRIADFKRANMDYMARTIDNKKPGFEEEKAISSVYWSLMRDDEARTYIENEKKLVETLNNIYDIIANSCDLDLF